MLSRIRLMIDPLVVGGGKRILRDDGVVRPLRLIEQPGDNHGRDPGDPRSRRRLTSPT
jgi:hypothetical protein